MHACPFVRFGGSPGILLKVDPIKVEAVIKDPALALEWAKKKAELGW